MDRPYRRRERKRRGRTVPHHAHARRQRGHRQDQPDAQQRRGQHASDILWIARDGRPEILLAVQNSVYMGEDFYPSVMRYDVSTGRGKVYTKAIAACMTGKPMPQASSAWE